MKIKIQWLSLAMAVMLFAAACQPQENPGPTLIPTGTASPQPTITLSPTQTLVPTQPPTAEAPPLLPIITATVAPSPLGVLGGGGGIVVDVPPPTPGPKCFKAQPGDTLGELAYRAGYNDWSVLPAIRELNGMCATCNDVQVGREYCVPRPTATPTPPGGEATAAARGTELAALPTRGYSIVKYKIQSDDNIISIQIRTGASLADICRLNDGVINCAGCDLTKPIGEQGCRPIVVEGAEINVPGPPPTATITPTLTGLETATPTPVYAAPRVISPVNNEVKRGIVQLLWLPAGVLQPDEFYLVVWSDQASGQTRQQETKSTSYRLPETFEPPPGETHTLFWRVSVARRAEDGSYIVVSPEGLIYTFLWQGQ